MTDTAIEWTDKTWNPVTGCSKVSPGCAHCYAEGVADRFWGTQYPMVEIERASKGALLSDITIRPRQFTDVRTHADRLDQPIRWKKPARIFVNSMSDLFHEDVPFEFIDQVFAVMALAPWHVFQILTKRPERMRTYLATMTFGNSIISEPSAYKRVVDAMDMPAWLPAARRFIRVPEEWPLPNVWLGVSVENENFLHRIDQLKDTPAAVHFVSIEPLLEDLGALILDGIDWVIVGGESGPKARPCNVRWIRSVVSECRRARVPVFVKQLGANVIDRNDAGFMGEWPEAWPDVIDQEDRIEHDLDGTRDGYQGAPVRIHLRSKKGGDMAEWPEDLRVREFPR